MKLSKQDESLIAIAAGFSIIAIVSHQYLFFIVVGIAVIGFPFPVLKNIVHWVWLKISEILGWLTQRIILSLLFFIILTPLAFLKRNFGKDTLKVKAGNRTTAFIIRNHTAKPGDLENTW